MGYIVIKGAYEIVWQTKIKVEHSPLSVYVNDPMLQSSCFLHLPGIFSLEFSLAILLPWLEWPERFPSS